MEHQRQRWEWSPTLVQPLSTKLSHSNASDPANQGLGKRLISRNRQDKLWLEPGPTGPDLETTDLENGWDTQQTVNTVTNNPLL
ncbi:hypothetical protein SRHO_G00190140 [Serrasalmus rhombeus]